MLRLGLCCIFHHQPIRFRTTTAAVVSRLSASERNRRLADLCLHNAASLLAALRFCAEHGIGCFRMNSQILPLKTHPTCGYAVGDLPDGAEIVSRFRECGAFARKHDLRTCLHPDQFVVLNSPRPEVVDASARELEYQAEVAEWVGADVINLHGGGAYGDKPRALADLARAIELLPAAVRARLTLENDDRIFTPSDLLPICRSTGTPLVYDVHHHRCNPDGLTLEQATAAALSTWDREPLFHVSSPLEGWEGPRPQRHHDYIEPADFPPSWLDLDLTVEIEAKAKECAVLRLREQLGQGLPVPLTLPGAARSPEG